MTSLENFEKEIQSMINGAQTEEKKERVKMNKNLNVFADKMGSIVILPPLAEGKHTFILKDYEVRYTKQTKEPYLQLKMFVDNEREHVENIFPNNEVNQLNIFINAMAEQHNELYGKEWHETFTYLINNQKVCNLWKITTDKDGRIYHNTWYKEPNIYADLTI